MEKLLNRSEIDDKYKWNLKAMFADEQELDKTIEEGKRLVDTVLKYKGKIMNDSQTLYNFYQDYEKMERVLEKVLVYSSLNYDADTSDNKASTLKLKIEKLCDEVNQKLSFISSEMLSVDFSQVLEYIEQNEKLKPYQFDLKQLFKYKEHTLSEKEEELITKAGTAMGYCSDVFHALNDTDIDLGYVNVDGKKQELTNSNYNVFMRNKNRKIRKEAFEKLYNYYQKHINTLAANLRGNVKEDLFISDVRNFKNPLEQSLYNDDIDTSVYKNLIKTVHNNLDKMYRYLELKRQQLNLDELHMYDIYVNLSKENNKKIEFEEAKQLLFKALEPLGKDYLNDLNQAFEQKWIDIYPNKGKRSGAYSGGCYDSYPYLLLNFENDINSVSTLVHELGHSMHSYYSNKTQPYTYQGYSIFLAEIASTVNEMLLNNYLYEHAKTKDEKIFYLNEFLDDVRATIIRQTMFAEFEMLIFDKEQQGVPLTVDEINNTYYELNKLYFGPNVISDEQIKYEWARIPHFYTPFYVYKYATGLSSALAIVTDLLNNKEDTKEKYLEFLSSGCSDYPLEILKKVGVDMTTTEPIQKAFDMFEEKLNELEKLLNN